MKFLIITQYFPPEVGAAQTRLGAMSKVLTGLGHEVEVVTAMPNYPMGEISQEYKFKFYVKELWQKIPVHRFWLWASQGRALSRLMAFLTLMITAMFGVSKVKKPDVIIVNSGPIFLGITGVFYSKILRVPMVFLVADLWPRSVEHLQGLGSRIFLKIALWLEAWLYKNSVYVTTLTDLAVEYLIKEKELPPEKVLFLPNGVDVDIFHPRPKNEELVKKYKLEGKTVFIYPGNHGYAHALESLIAAADLLKSHPEIVFLLVGGGSEKPKLKKMAAEKGIENVIFVDPVAPEILADYIEVADFGLIHVRNGPLAAETRPAKMFPIMAMAKPIVYAGWGEGADLLQKVGGGWVIEPENPQALKEKALYLSRNVKGTPEAEERGRRNIEFVRNKLSVNSLVSDWLKTLKL